MSRLSWRTIRRTMRSILTTLLSAFVCAIVNAQFSFPKCADYDAYNDRWIVVQGISPVFMEVVGGFASSYTDATFVPENIRIEGDTLFHVWGNQVGAFNVTTLAPAFSQVLTSASDLRAIAVRGPDIFVADFTEQEIWRVPLDGGLVSPLVAPLSFIPSAMVYDAVGDRLVLCGWGPNGDLHAVDPDDGAVTDLAGTNLSNLSGIDIDCHGNFLVSSQLPDQITSFEPTFTQAGVPLFTAGLLNPGGIGYDEYHDVLAIPNTSGSTVLFEEVDCSSGRSDGLATPSTTLIIPNPATTPRVRITGDRHVTGAVQFFDGSGRSAGGSVPDHQGLIDISGLSNGPWIIRIASTGERLRLLVMH